MTSVGEKLKQERESRRTSLEDLAGSTGIGLPYLEALEHGEFEALPGRAFGKLYIRAYAEVLGFDPEPLIAAYDRERTARERELPPEARQPRPVMVRPEPPGPARETMPDGEREEPDDDAAARPPGEPPVEDSRDASEAAVTAGARETPPGEDPAEATPGTASRDREEPVATAGAPDAPPAAAPRAASARRVVPPAAEAPAAPAGSREAALATLLRRADGADTVSARSRAWRIGLAVAAGVAVVAIVALGIRGVGRGQADPAGTGADAARTVADTSEADMAGTASNEPSATPEPNRVEASGPSEAESTGTSKDEAEAPAVQEQPAAPVKAEPPAPAPATTAAGRLRVSEHGLGRRIVNRRVETPADRFQEGEVAWFATRVLGGRRGDHIRHVWLREGKPVQSIRLSLGGSHWRTYSNKTLWGAGSWTVEARDGEGRVLASASFTCTPRSR